MYGNPRARWSGDEDGDWDVTKDDIGVDGILNPNAPDFWRRQRSARSII